MTSKKRRIALAATLATLFSGGAAAGLVAPAGASAPQARSAGASRCSASGLVVWLNTQGNGAAGSSYYQLQLTNLSGRTCSLSGFPGVSAVGLSGAQLGSSAEREVPSGKAKTVRLANGASAVATLRIVEAGNFPKSTCRQTTAAGLRVYPPGQTSSKVVPFPFEACARTGPAYLSIGSVRKS